MWCEPGEGTEVAGAGCATEAAGVAEGVVVVAVEDGTAADRSANVEEEVSLSDCDEGLTETHAAAFVSLALSSTVFGAESATSMAEGATGTESDEDAESWGAGDGCSEGE